MIALLFRIAFFTGLHGLSDSLPKKDIPVHSILEEKQTITISSTYEVKQRTERSLTVLSPEGLPHAYTSIFYDNLNEITGFEAEVVDLSTGKTIQKAKLKDMSDAAIYSNSSIFDDNRRKYFEAKSGKFPVQIKIVYETKSKTNFNLPAWVPVHRYNQQVKQSCLTVNYPTEIGIRYKELNLFGERTQSEADGITSITWTEKNLPIQTPALKQEDDHKVLLAPINFALNNYTGKMEDWSGLASWQYQLNKGRNELPVEFKEKIRRMVSETEDTYEKIKILYGFLQKNYRYVSIQLGIGGWQTMSASDVVKYSYGDCKGLTNLMQAMLETVGIPSNYTLVYAGKSAKDIEVDLPSNQFNHVILQVPLNGQPVWLECTSNLLPAGYLGDFTKNRHVLVITSDGGFITKTPAYTTEEWNKATSRSELKIDAQGNALIQSDLSFEGNFAEDLISVKHGLDSRQQRDYFNKNSPVSGLVVDRYSLELMQKDSLPFAELSYQGVIQKFVQSTAKRLILKPFLGKVTEEMLVNNSLNLRDEYIIELPDILESENNLDDVALIEDGVSLKLSNRLEGKKLFVTREIELVLPENPDQQTEILRRINSLGSKSYYFTKPIPAN